MANQNRLAHLVLPNHHQAARDYRRLMANSNSSKVKKILHKDVTLFTFVLVIIIACSVIVMMISSYLYQRKTEKLLTIKDPT